MYATGFMQICAFISSQLVKSQFLLLLSSSPSSSFAVKSVSRSTYYQYCGLFGVIVLCLIINMTTASPLRTSNLSRPKGSSLLSSSSSSRKPSMISTSSPKWVNPCRLPFHILDPSKDFADAPTVPIDDLLVNVLSTAKRAKYHAKLTKQKFLNKTLNDPEFEDGVKGYRQEWLPILPEPKKETLKKYQADEAFKKAFEYMQYFAVGLEQILLDRVLHDGKLLHEFKDVESNMFQLLCEIQLGMYILRIKPETHVLRDVMSQNYRDLKNSSLRDIRDYLILRDYIKATDFIAQLFNYLKTKNTSYQHVDKKSQRQSTPYSV